MIPILTLAEMQEVERRTTNEFGLSEYDMIMSAGEAVFETIKTMMEQIEAEESITLEAMEEEAEGLPQESPLPRISSHRDESIAFVCGPGHNGADGLAAALLATQAGYGVVIYQTPPDHGYSIETERLHQQVADADLTINFIRSPLDLPVFQGISLIVDALLGSGINRNPDGLIRSCIYGMNQSGVPILSIDVPSGIRCDTADAVFGAIEASATLCLGSMKISGAFYPSSLAFGKVGYSPICFDERLLGGQPSRMFLYSMDDATLDFPVRKYTANKYNSGKVLVISGSRGMHGAAALCSNSALRSGAGIVKLAYPAGIHTEATVHILEVIGVPIGSSEGLGYAGPGHFRPQHIAELKPLIEWADSILVGPGIGNHPETLAFIDQLIPQLKGLRTVIDGDALAYFKPDFVASHTDLRGFDQFVLTPHAGEFKRMGGEYDYDEPLELIKTVRKFSESRNLNVLLKGATTLFAPPGGKVTALSVGNPGMATAGSGDVLAGVVAGLLAVNECDIAATLGAFAHGKSGDLAREDRGTLGLVASDLLLYIPMALMEIEEESDIDTEEWPSE